MKKFPKLKSKLILAPMHDTTNIAFRIICKKYGASLVSTELLSANAIARGNKAALKATITNNLEKPVVAQIFGQNTELLVKAAKILEKEFDIIDFNLGCPSKKIMEQGSGSALLRRKNKILEIVKALSKELKKPLTVKIRSGYDENLVNGVEISKMVEPFVSAIIVHARTAKQGYSGKANWDIIKEIKENVKIPVIGNGDVWNGINAKEMIEQTKCDYVMIGRGAIGNPFIFKQIAHYLKTEELISQKVEDKIKDYFEYIELTKKYDIFSIKDAKQKAIEFTKGLPGSSKLRQKMNSMKNYEDIEKAIKHLNEL